MLSVPLRSEVPEQDSPLGLQGLQIGGTDEILDWRAVRFPAWVNGRVFAVASAPR
jgi:hypothetical protein